ncbi:hypothetical protein E2562_002148 [Oryza meyeriana var. granulata]|uniref:Uncharacterized protein n=1 Tax=Oryza meyeriana var. granulata TaxID=110450 RepID=A0A6G1EDM5_9ORYZ|nr:hypothetical protein E2562_002148 [Oryza meyeriana var. granulata]
MRMEMMMLPCKKMKTMLSLMENMVLPAMLNKVISSWKSQVRNLKGMETLTRKMEMMLPSKKMKNMLSLMEKMVMPAVLNKVISSWKKPLLI